MKYLAYLLTFIILSGCNIKQNQEVIQLNKVINNNHLKGQWLLINPEAIKTKIVVGALNFCHDTTNKNCNDFTLALLQSNNHHGCTDFIASGYISYKENPWQLYFYDEQKVIHSGNAFKKGDLLVVQLKESNFELKFMPSSEKKLNDNIKASCSPEEKL
ncbi:hypothetical protein [Photobacterium carnosum]|uniref:hypothetical protein n=1 Tax=Photobacterium carnosum TaxID=2023717 RepID=UPI001E61043B|nr:hypothetical protein [Photobacterium carnosum]MCD9515606.1 hypothetical protein [Photobacterium carnosum]